MRLCNDSTPKRLRTLLHLISVEPRPMKMDNDHIVNGELVVYNLAEGYYSIPPDVSRRCVSLSAM